MVLLLGVAEDPRRPTNPERRRERTTVVDPGQAAIGQTIGQTIGLRLAMREQSALADAYAAFAPSVLSYVTRFVGPSDAEDVVQRTFLDAWRFASAYDPERRFSGWLFTIARRRALDTLRSRRPTMDLELARDLVGDDGRETAQRLADAAELRSSLDRLPEHEREVLELTYFAELTQSEVAGRLGVPIGTVKARGSRGTRRLRRLMRAAADTEPLGSPR
jgi:RNA polymerase sigma factor (sigma-70 family)